MHCTIHQYVLQISWNPPPHLWSPAHLWLKAPPTLRWLWSPAHFRAKAPPTWRSPAAAIPTWRRAGVLKSRTVWTKSGRMATIAGSLVAFVPPTVRMKFMPLNIAYKMYRVCDQSNGWTDGVRHVPTVLVERVPVSKYVLVLLGF